MTDLNLHFDLPSCTVATTTFDLFLFDLKSSSGAAATHRLCLSQPENVKNGKLSNDLHWERPRYRSPTTLHRIKCPTVQRRGIMWLVPVAPGCPCTCRWTVVGDVIRLFIHGNKPREGDRKTSEKYVRSERAGEAGSNRNRQTELLS